MFGWLETAWHYIIRGFGVIFPPFYRRAPYHLIPFPKSPRLYHMKLYIALFPVFQCTICNNYVLHPLYIILVLWSMQVQTRRQPSFYHNNLPMVAFPAHRVQNGPWTARPSGYDQVCSMLPVCSSLHPCRPVWTRLTAAPSLSLWFQPRNSTINWVPMWRKTTSTPCWCNP